HEHLRREGRVRVEGVHGPGAASVTEGGEVGAGGAGGVDVDQTVGPVGKEMRLAVGRLLNHGVEPGRVLAVGEKERAVVQTDRAAGCDHNVPGRDDLQYGGGARLPLDTV